MATNIIINAARVIAVVVGIFFLCGTVISAAQVVDDALDRDGIGIAAGLMVTIISCAISVALFAAAFL